MDKEMMKKMMGKNDEDSSDMKKEAKLSVLKELRKMASDMMGDDVKGGMMKKVTVASPSTEGLKEGLSKAEDMMESAPESDEMDAYEDDDMDMENCSPEELDAKIAKLQELKAKMSK